MQRLIVSAIPFLMAACGDQNSAAPPESHNAAAAPAARNVVDTGIPSAIAGRWGLVPVDCTSTLGDAKGLIVVSPEDIRFYESRATLAQTTARTPRSVAGTFSFSGEGTTWSREMKLELSDDGTALTRSEFGPDAAVTPLRYARCDATP